MVVLNKPNKPDYSQAKAYRPISLLECTGKLMEKIITKRVNHDIAAANLLSISQFGLHPHYTAVDAVTTLVHRIQATHATGHTATLLLFDISRFFNNMNPEWVAQIFWIKGFLGYTCEWI